MELVLSEPKVFFNIASFFLTLVVLVFSLRRFPTTRQSRYFCLFIISILVAASDETLRTLSYHFPFSPNSTFFFLRFIQSMNFITSTFMLLCYTLYMNSLIDAPTRFSKCVLVTNITIFVIYSIICIISIKTGWIVSYDPAIRRFDLVRGPLYLYVGYFVPVYMITIEVVIFLYNINSYPKKIKWTMLISILASGGVMFLQPMVANYVSIVPFGATVSLYIWYLALENGDYKKLQKVQTKLAAATHEAQLANEAKNAFLTNMSHEIRTPLNVILGLDEMILNSNNEKEIQDYAADIHDSGKSLLAIINNILDYSKLESDRMELVAGEYHLWDFMETIKTEFEPQAKSKGIDFFINIDENLPDYLYGDLYHLTKILRNLILNAIKYTEQGSITLSVSGTEKDSKLNLVYEVEDTGKGISDEDLPGLFHSFQHFDTIRRNDMQGTGLGLAISHKLISLLGGTISFNTKKGNGSKFKVNISQKIVSPGTVAERRKHAINQEREISGHLKAPGCKVLLVDDNPMNLVVASGLLKKTDAKIHTCESGRICLELMKKEKYDIIFLDQFMPETNGIETFKQSKEMPGNLNLSTPVVLFTANVDPEKYGYYTGLGFADYVFKPIDRDKLFEVFFRIVPKELIISND